MFPTHYLIIIVISNFKNYRSVVGNLEELIKHGLRALRDTLPNEVDLTTKVVNFVP